MAPSELARLDKPERTRLIAWTILEAEIQGYAQALDLFREAGMDVELGDWLEMDGDARRMKIAFARKAAREEGG